MGVGILVPNNANTLLYARSRMTYNWLKKTCVRKHTSRYELEMEMSNKNIKNDSRKEWWSAEHL